jgi:hypothetical protein
MVRAMGEYFTNWARKYMPDPWLFAILLTFITYILGLIFTKSGPFDMILHWYKGFWELLAFAMQMCLILVTGYSLATAPAVKRALDSLARVPTSNSGATYLIVLVAIIAGYINWGLGLIVGAMMAKEVAKQGYLRKIRIHYPLMGAAGYIGLAVWHGGLSGSAPLLVATKGHFLEKEIGIIPVVQTLFSPLNLGIFILMIVVLPFLAKALAPRDEKEIMTIDQYDPALLQEEKVEAAKPTEQWTTADRLPFRQAGFRPQPEHREFYLPHRGDAPAQNPHLLCPGGHGRDPGMRRDHPSISFLRGDHGDDEILRAGCGHRRLVRGDLHLPDLSRLDLHCRLYHQYLRTFRRRTVGGSGTDCGQGCPVHAALHPQDGHGGSLRGSMDQPLSALLGPPPPGHHPPESPGHHGVLHRDYVYRDSPFHYYALIAPRLKPWPQGGPRPGAVTRKKGRLVRAAPILQPVF